MLYSFNLHVRQDSEAVYNDSRAEAILGKLSNRHEAAKRYFTMTYRVAKSNSATVVVPPASEEEEEQSNLLSCNDSLPNGCDASEEIDDYMIFTTKHLRSEQSRVFCVNENINTYNWCNYSIAARPGIPASSGTCQPGTGIGIYTGRGGRIYVLTYAPIPIRWQARDDNGASTGTPNHNLAMALQRYGGNNNRFGYIISASEAGSLNHKARNLRSNERTEFDESDFTHFLKSGYGDIFPIPNAISQALEFGDDGRCCTGEDCDSDAHCVAAMSILQ